MPDPTARWAELARLARTHFSIQRFRPGQRELIEAVLAGRDAIGVMPTGAGKSLTYQLPALSADKDLEPLDAQDSREGVGTRAAHKSNE